MITTEQMQRVVRIQNELSRFDGHMDEVMDFVVAQAASLVNADGAVIELAEGGELVVRGAAGMLRDQLGMRSPQAGGMSGQCMESGAALYGEDAASGLPSLVVVPLRNDGMTIGVLKAVSTGAPRFGEGDAALLDLVAGLLTASFLFAAHYNSDALFHLATHDRLTEVANRPYFMDRLDHAVDQSKRTQQAIAVLIINMDGMRIVNEQYGRQVGDALLREYASCLKSVVRRSDTIGRLGGDEFALILSPINSPEVIDIAIKRITDESVYPFLHEGNMYLLRASIGSAYYPGDAKDSEQLHGFARDRMLAAKEEQKQRQSIFQPLVDL